MTELGVFGKYLIRRFEQLPDVVTVMVTSDSNMSFLPSLLLGTRPTDVGWRCCPSSTRSRCREAPSEP
jgi:hypothetical protein